MLDALLETIGTLAVLASIAAKWVYLRSAPRAGDDATAQERAESRTESHADRRAGGAIAARPAHGGRRAAVPVARCRK